MATINRAIRFYQPNDPYYWQVDNLPLTDLLDNDIILEERIGLLEDAVKGLGDTDKGSFGLGALADLKAWVEPVDGAPEDFGKVFVRPGKFNARMQLYATAESGWRMMRDNDNNFNNTAFDIFGGGGGLNSTTLSEDFVRYTKGIGRTSVVELYQNDDQTDKSVVIQSFDTNDFNFDQAPSERLDLIYIKASAALDTDFESAGIPKASVGVIKGAGFRSDPAAGVKGNGNRFETDTGRLAGKITGMASSEVAGTTPFGSVPSPDDLNNFAWHSDTTVAPTPATWDIILQRQVETQAAFTLPIAYVKVPQGYVTGQPIPKENVIDIRPFFRSTELTYNERAAVAAANAPAGSNPFITESRFQYEIVALGTSIAGLAGQVQENTSKLAINTLDISALQTEVSQLTEDVQGTGSASNSAGLQHEGRIAALEALLGGGISVPVERHKFLSAPFEVFNTTVAGLGSSSAPKNWNITDAIPAGDREGIVAVQFRFIAKGGSDDTDSINTVRMQGGPMQFRMVSTWGVAQSGGDLRRNDGMINTFYAPVNKTNTGGSTLLQIQTWATGSSDVQHYCYIDGYITTEYSG